MFEFVNAFSIKTDINEIKTNCRKPINIVLTLFAGQKFQMLNHMYQINNKNIFKKLHLAVSVIPV